MTTPTALDVSGYIDLTLYDVDVPALVERALARVEAVFPEWTPREGNIEVVLLEAFALEVQELAYAINRLPGAVTEVLLRLFQLERSPGVRPTADVRFSVQTAGDAVIPAGTSVAVALTGGLDPVIFRTVTDAPVPGGTTAVTVPARGTRHTTDANTVSPASTAVLLDAVAFVNSATLTITGAGANPEATEAFLNRGVQRLRRLSTTLVRPEHYTAAALETPAVRQAIAVNNYDPGQTPPTGRRGHISVAVVGAGGAPLAEADRIVLENDLKSQGHAGLDVHVVNPTLTPVDVTATLTRLTGYTIAEVQDAALAALRAYLSPDAWTFGATVHRNELIALLDRVPGVDLVTMPVPAGNVDLVGAAPLVTAGTFTVNVR